MTSATRSGVIPPIAMTGTAVCRRSAGRLQLQAPARSRACSRSHRPDRAPHSRSCDPACSPRPRCGSRYRSACADRVRRAPRPRRRRPADARRRARRLARPGSPCSVRRAPKRRASASRSRASRTCSSAGRSFSRRLAQRHPAANAAPRIPASGPAACFRSVTSSSRSITSRPARIAGSRLRHRAASGCVRQAAPRARLRPRRASRPPSAPDRAPSRPRY